MLNAVGRFLSSQAGIWFGMAVGAVCCAVAWWSVNVSTYALSVMAIVWTLFVLARQGVKEREDAIRDKAIHLKLDTLIRGVPAADNAVAEIERRMADGAPAA